MAVTRTHCPYCALQCGMLLRTSGGSVSVAPLDFPTNGGGLCQKGWTAAELLSSPERLTEPLARDERAGPLHPVSWDEALDRICAGVRRARTRDGNDAVAVFGGGGLTNEKAYQLGKFARVVLGTRHIDYNGRFCMSSAAAAGNRAFGVDRGLPFPLVDLAQADAILLVGGNLAETMPPIMRQFAAQRRRGGRLVVVDPRRTLTAERADLHLQVRPGTDAALALGLLHLAVSEGHVDHDYVARRTTGWEAIGPTLAQHWPERVERITGVPVPRLREAVRLLGTARRAFVLTARGAEQHANGVDTVAAFIDLALALGLPGRPGSGFGTVTGQGNGQGGREHGQKSDQLPGYRRLDDPAARRDVAAVWGVDPAELPAPGPGAFTLLDSLGQPAGPRALLVFGSNIAVSAPDGGRIRDRLAALDLLVVTDVVLSETARLADVVLPVAQWAEEDGTMTNLEGRVIRRRRAIPPPPGVRTDLQVLAALARRLSPRHVAGFPDDSGAVFTELARASAGGVADYGGITYERIDRDAVFWPCPDPDHPGTPRLFTDRFPTPDGRARFVPVDFEVVAEEPCADYPLYLTTGRLLAHYQSGAQTRRIAPLRAAVAAPYLEIHPDVAARLGIADRDMVRIRSRRGTARAAARLVASIRYDTVFMPFHWSGRESANALTNPRLDPVSGMPSFKVCAVRVEPDTEG